MLFLVGAPGGINRVREKASQCGSASFEMRSGGALLRMRSVISKAYLTLRRPEEPSRRMLIRESRIFPQPVNRLGVITGRGRGDAGTIGHPWTLASTARRSSGPDHATRLPQQVSRVLRRAHLVAATGRVGWSDRAEGAGRQGDGTNATSRRERGSQATVSSATRTFPFVSGLSRTAARKTATPTTVVTRMGPARVI